LVAINGKGDALFQEKRFQIPDLLVQFRFGDGIQAFPHDLVVEADFPIFFKHLVEETLGIVMI
jgi:hypothetical protein